MKAENQKVWFITGASTGFGKAIAEVVLERGDIAVATFRKEEQANAFSSNDDGKLGVVLDVTDKAQIKNGVDKALEAFEKIDVLVNNAGYGSMGSLEEVDEQELRYQFDVNVFGAVNMIKAVLPYMRQQKSGNILNITSIGGLTAYPGVSVYNGSKFALEGIAEGLAKEIAHLGIKLTNIEPGPFRTDWAGRSANYVDTQIEDYKESGGESLKWIQSISGNQAGDPIRAAHAMFEVTRLENPPVHLPLGASAYNDALDKFETIVKEIHDFEHLGKPTDFPEEELAKK